MIAIVTTDDIDEDILLGEKEPMMMGGWNCPYCSHWNDIDRYRCEYCDYDRGRPNAVQAACADDS
jgi:DNA-directed RNA polymerase subunit RPC12/RpoP